MFNHQRCTVKFKPQNDRLSFTTAKICKHHNYWYCTYPINTMCIYMCSLSYIYYTRFWQQSKQMQLDPPSYITKSLHPFHNQWARSLMIIGATRPWASHVLEGCGCCYILHVLSNKELVVVICIFSSNEIQCSHHIRSPVDRTGPQFIKQYSSMVLSPQSTNQWP